MRLHADELSVDVGLVRRLIASQHPEWSGLPVVAVQAGTDHALYRLGDTLLVRLPRHPTAALQVEKEQRWLPLLARELPLDVPAPVAQGAPGAGYPCAWSVYSWLEGEPAALDRVREPVRAARTLGAFLIALRRIDAASAPAPGAHNSRRGVPLIERDAATRAAIAELGSAIDGPAALAAWRAALEAPAHAAPACWVHGDLLPANLLLRAGELCAVIDWGCAAAGDPACDALLGWTLLSGEARKAFRDASGLDAAAWARGRGWALSFGAIALPYYAHTNPALAAVARRAIDAVLADAGSGSGA